MITRRRLPRSIGLTTLPPVCVFAQSGIPWQTTVTTRPRETVSNNSRLDASMVRTSPRQVSLSLSTERLSLSGTGRPNLRNPLRAGSLSVPVRSIKLTRRTSARSMIHGGASPFQGSQSAGLVPGRPLIRRDCHPGSSAVMSCVLWDTEWPRILPDSVGPKSKRFARSLTT
jgi:hypothetical protein